MRIRIATILTTLMLTVTAVCGQLDNSVGFIYVKDKKDLPEMNPGRIIMIREITNGWYIYKTT